MGPEALAAAAPARPAIHELPYLRAYPQPLQEQAARWLADGQLQARVLQRHPQAHTVRTDRALYDYVAGIRSAHLRHAQALSSVAYDNKLHVVHNALGTHTRIARVQGNKLKAKREIRVASLFKQAPADFLRMIVVHELAHLKERDHGKAFYALCTYMEPDYHALEWDLRLWLTALELQAGPGP